MTDLKGSNSFVLYLSQKAFVFGEQTSAVLHRNIQSPPVELHEGNGELKPNKAQRDRADSVLTTLSLLMSSGYHQRGSGTHVWS